MAVRDTLRERAQPFLDPGEQIQAVVPCQTGPSPWLGALSWLLVAFGAKFYVVVATDRNLVAMRTSMWRPFKPKALEQRFSRATRFGPLSGLWAKSEVLGTKTHINKRWHRDAAEADALAGAGGAPAAAQSWGAAATAPGATPAGWYPDPNDASRQRYWDGAAWTEHVN